MNSKPYNFYPFFDPRLYDSTLSWTQKIAISAGLGLSYSLIQYLNLTDKTVFFDQFSWVLSLVITSAMLALYIASAILRDNIILMHENSGELNENDRLLNLMMANRNYILAGTVFAIMTTGVSISLGIPEDFNAALIPLLSNNLGAVMSGFAAGMGLWGIISVIVLFLKFAPSLQYSLDPDSPDGSGGIKKLGDSLWFFSFLIAAVGLLVSAYMFSVDWTNMQSEMARTLFVTWLAMPYVMAISVVLVPGLAVRRQVNDFKLRREEQLKKARAEAYSSYKEFEPVADDDIIASKKKLEDRLNHIQGQMERLRSMRASPLDSIDKKK